MTRVAIYGHPNKLCPSYFFLRWRQCECATQKAYPHSSSRSTTSRSPYKTCSSKYARCRTSRLRNKTVRAPTHTQLTHLHPRPVKAGYPPRSLVILPDLPLSSLGIKPGDQIIVVQKPNPPPQAPAPARSTGPDYVQTDDGSFLIHRVRPSTSIRRLAPDAVSPQIVPDDNSCLFSAVALVLTQDISQAPLMRKSTSLSHRPYRLTPLTP